MTPARFAAPGRTAGHRLVGRPLCRHQRLSNGRRALHGVGALGHRAFNRNLPFDQFTVEQIAGDMLPRATLDQICHRVQPQPSRQRRRRASSEEYLRRIRSWTALKQPRRSGLADLGCTRCHDHKVRSVHAEGVLSTLRLLQQCSGHGKAVKYGNSLPIIKRPRRGNNNSSGISRRQHCGCQGAFEDLKSELKRPRPPGNNPGRHCPKSIGRSRRDWSPISRTAMAATRSIARPLAPSRVASRT